jgi:hypothetical protein
MKIISASIDLTKIDKSKINNHKNGSQRTTTSTSSLKMRRINMATTVPLVRARAKRKGKPKKRRCTSVMAKVFGMVMRVPKVRTKLTFHFKLGFMKNLFTFEK